MRDLTYFISDLHLGAGYIPDHRAHERKVVGFLRSIEPRAKRIYLLGDILDYWWEYRDVVPRGFVRFFGELARLSDAGVEITWFKGNHDVWIFDYLPSEIGLEVHDGIMVRDIDGARFLMEHGDGVGRLPWTFRRLRALFRCRVAQRMFAAIHPRWTVGFAHAWSSHSRKTGGYVPHDGVGESLVEYAEQYNEEAVRAGAPRVDYFIVGRLHTLLERTIPDWGKVVVLGDWISKFTYAVWDGKSLKTEKYSD